MAKHSETIARRKDFLFIAATLAVFVAGLLLLAFKVPMLHEMMQVEMLFAGMLGIAALSTFSRYIEGPSNAPVIQITFNEARARQTLDDLINFAYAEEIERNLRPKVQIWEPTSDSLKDEDPALALAKLRIDVERELRRIAFETKIAIEPRKTSIGYLLDTLAQRQVLNDRVVAAIRDVLPVCNLAIHGGEISPEVASSVLNVGEDLLRVLRVTDGLAYSVK